MITDQQCRDFIANEAANMAVEFKADAIYLCCLTQIHGSGTVIKGWSVSLNSGPQVHKPTLRDLNLALHEAASPASRIAKAAQLRREADALEASVGIVNPASLTNPDALKAWWGAKGGAS